MSKLLILGHARHGKDTVCEILRDKYGYQFMSSSEFCAGNIVFPVLADKYNYDSVKTCFEDRVNHREEWFNLIADYNKDDPSRLGREIFAKYDIYCGLRNINEMKAMGGGSGAGLYNFSIWVDAGDRVPPEPKTSNTITSRDADYIIKNTGTLRQLEYEVYLFMIRHQSRRLRLGARACDQDT